MAVRSTRALVGLATARHFLGPALRAFSASVVALLALAAYARPAGACSVCNCGDPTLTAVGVEQPYRNRIRAGIEERYGSHEQGDALTGESLQQLRSALLAAWSPHARITVGVVLPWMTTWMTPASNGKTQLINGLADLELSGRVLIARDKSFGAHHLFWATAGLKMPTGPRLRDDQGFPYPDDDQPGSGSWDPFAGVTYAWFSGEMWSAFASASYRYTTKGWHGYLRGMQVGWNVALQAQPWEWGGVQLFVDGNWMASDRLESGAAMPNTGGTVMRVGPAFVYSPRMDLMLRLAASLPLVHEFNGVQRDGPQVTLSLIWDIR